MSYLFTPLQNVHIYNRDSSIERVSLLKEYRGDFFIKGTEVYPLTAYSLVISLDISIHVHIDALIIIMAVTNRRIRGRKFTHLLIHIYFQLNITIMRQQPRIEYQQ
ncbi:unnamed protein product [Vicia faba]|uniref:Uncharacterized protein n=1 Tax=Vicia faba TaxID=3906 RepID=A0AAV0YMU4_VICFA|nr:unnamed protein product [Vicia faba]